MMLAYGEDALTLWALRSKRQELLHALDDHSNPQDCVVFYRPSFGRRGGNYRSEFGEFDFILLSSQFVYLGESKWDGSGERVINGALKLREEQLFRHWLMSFHIREWAAGDYDDWRSFATSARPKLQALGISKPLAPAGSLLATNLQQVLATIGNHIDGVPIVQNVLLYFHRSASMETIPKLAGDDFLVVAMDYTADLVGNYIILKK